jgi:hypothetical protein
LEILFFEFYSHPESIDSHAFANHPNLKFLHFPAILSSIHGSAFFGCRFDRLSVTMRNRWFSTTGNSRLLNQEIEAARDFESNPSVLIALQVKRFGEG